MTQFLYDEMARELNISRWYAMRLAQLYVHGTVDHWLDHLWREALRRVQARE